MLDRKEKNDRRRVLRDESIVVSLKWNVQRVIRKNVALHVPLSLKVCLGDDRAIVHQNVTRPALLHKLGVKSLKYLKFDVLQGRTIWLVSSLDDRSPVLLTPCKVSTKLVALFSLANVGGIVKSFYDGSRVLEWVVFDEYIVPGGRYDGVKFCGRGPVCSSER